MQHERLLNNLDSYDVCGNVRRWVTMGPVSPQINDQTSKWSPVTSGIPHGSVLGTILLVVFFNDLPDVVHSTIKIFADLQTMLSYGTMTSDQDRKQIQKEIDKLSDWSDRWLLKFNNSKCGVMHIGHSNPKLDYITRGNSGVYQSLGETELEKNT